ncbi:MAG: SAM-dependent methyltransferase [Bacteroidales bacterium]|nr:SAM-dependent methyltransferase [Bacteroidales bacterium]
MSLNDTTRQFIRENLNADVPTLALKKAPVGTDVSLALRQIAARQLLQKKVPQWANNEDLLFPAHLSIEQCSSEAAARYKASLLEGKTFADLTGGLGIDTYYISQGFQQSYYVERQAELCDLARHNFEVLKADIKVWNETTEDYLMHCEPKDCLFIDPTRRDEHGHKTVSIADCTPNVAALQDLLMQKGNQVMIKLSPMLDVSKALEELCHVKEVHVVAVTNECKELDVILESGYDGEPQFVCVNLLTTQSELRFTLEEERNCPNRLVEDVSKYLYEPNSALMKAGCFKLLTERFDVFKLHKNSNIYTAEQLVPDFPGRIFEVEGWAVYNKKVKQTLLHDVDKASIAVRNFPLSVAELRKTLKIGDGDAIFLFATTLKGEKKIIIRTKKAASDETASLEF